MYDSRDEYVRSNKNSSTYTKLKRFPSEPDSFSDPDDLPVKYVPSYSSAALEKIGSGDICTHNVTRGIL